MKTVQHQFVEFIPDDIQEGILYISIPYATVIHKCACGCGNEVVTPLSPEDWQFTFDGKTVSLYPSIGSRNLMCKSHYWITQNQIEYEKNYYPNSINGSKFLSIKSSKRNQRTRFSKKDKRPR
jgi:hypothetical protein